MYYVMYRMTAGLGEACCANAKEALTLFNALDGVGVCVTHNNVILPMDELKRQAGA